MTIESFDGVDTTTNKKLEVIAWQTQIIKKYFPRGFREYCLGLPGDANQCDRHIIEYAGYGILSRKKIFVDYDLDVHMGHIQWKKEINLRIKLIYDTIWNALNSEWKKGKQIDVIDYDGTRYFSYDHEQVLRAAALNDVKVVIMVMCLRRNTFCDYFNKWKKILKLKKEWCPKNQKYCEPSKKLSQRALDAIAEECGFESHFYPETYVGRTCKTDKRGAAMIAGVFFNKKFTEED